MTKTRFLTLALGLTSLTSVTSAASAAAQKPGSDSARMADMADHAMSRTMSGAMDVNMMKHMELTPTRPATHADSVKARQLAAELKRAIAKYQDTSVAVADGYRMFLPNVKDQQVYHFTNYGRAFKEAFRFNRDQPTSVLYSAGPTEALTLVGAMYTMPKSAKLDRLNDRGAARHRALAQARELVSAQERRTSAVLREDQRRQTQIGPESPIATRPECEVAGGEFHPNLSAGCCTPMLRGRRSRRDLWG